MSCCSFSGSRTLILQTLLQVHLIVSIKAICVHLFPETHQTGCFEPLQIPGFQKLWRTSPSLHLVLPPGQNAAPCPGTAAGPSRCLPQGCLGAHGLSCPEHRCPGLSRLQMGAQTQVRFARANSHLDFMMLQPGDADSCKVTSKENIR